MNTRGNSRILFIPDSHIPFHNVAACKLMLRAAKFYRPTHVVVLGDFGDYYSLSFFDKDPARRNNLKWELGEINLALDSLDSLGAKHKFFLFGNHEHRLARYIATKAPELAGMFSLEKELHLAKRGWAVTQYKRSLVLGKMRITHDRNQAGKTAHIAARSAYGSNAVIGHTHHAGLDYCGNALGEVHVGAVFGWLGDVEAVDYTHRDVALTWPLAFGTGLMESNGVTHLQIHPIIKGKVAMNGELIT